MRGLQSESETDLRQGVTPAAHRVLNVLDASRCDDDTIVASMMHLTAALRRMADARDAGQTNSITHHATQAAASLIRMIELHETREALRRSLRADD